MNKVKILAALFQLYFVPIAFAQISSQEFTLNSDLGGEIGTCKLKGTLLLPDNPLAVVLMVHGSGNLDRDETFPTSHRPFYDIANQLAENGIATARFDKRTHKNSCPDTLNKKSFSPYHYIYDAAAVAKHVRGMTKAPLYILGHSQGVNFAVELAKNYLDAKGVILLAGLIKSPIDATVLRQIKSLAGNMGAPPEQRAQYAKMYAEGKTFFSNARKGILADDEKFMDSFAKFWTDWITITDQALNHTDQLKVPGIILQGELDWNVDYTDYLGFQESLKVPGSSSQYFPDLDHGFCRPGETIVPPKVGRAISEWLKALSN